MPFPQKGGTLAQAKYAICSVFQEALSPKRELVSGTKYSLCLLLAAFSKKNFSKKQCLLQLLRHECHFILVDYLQAREPFSENVSASPRNLKTMALNKKK